MSRTLSCGVSSCAVGIKEIFVGLSFSQFFENNSTSRLVVHYIVLFQELGIGANNDLLIL